VSGHAGRGSLDAWATISALAAVTSTVRLGTLVSPATFRHPSELAKVAVTADQVSGGRVELGLGTGWLEAEHQAYGFPFPPLRERMEMLGEQLELLRLEWGDGPASFDGRHYRVRELDALPKPVQRPGPHLLVGGRGGPRSLALAARFADEYNALVGTPAECAELRRDLDEACRAAGRDPMPLSIMTGWLVGEDRAELDDRTARLADWYGPPGDDWIAGTLDEASERLRELSDAGVERVMCQHLLHRDLGAVEQIGRLSR
jgi:alkanesulfonate monooxygenase SsuD/methylene tetrahydromethanopterin reductase-like flavin-dependent oxidoreductase (luciferase family)